MPAISVALPYEMATNKSGDALDNGYIYIGVANLDPITNPITAYWDVALTIPVAQPIRTIGGYPALSGTPGRIYANSDYSITVKDKYGNLVYTAPTQTFRQSSDYIIYYNGGAGSVTRTVTQALNDFVNVKNHGVKGDGVTDDTAAIQSLADTLTAGGRLYFPKGVYIITAGIVFKYNRINVVGDGRLVTRIKFNPTANGAAFTFSTGVNAVLYQSSLSSLSFESDDTAYVKTAVKIVDVSAFTMRDVAIGPLWRDTSSYGCIGLHVNGREDSSFEDVEIYTQRPIVISDNPNSFIDIDHFNFHNLYVIVNFSSTNECIHIDTGVDLSNTTFTGRQAWVGGSSGLKWVDTTTTGASNNLSISGVRWENAVGSAGHMIDIQHNYKLQFLRIENCYGGYGANGIKLRKCQHVTIANTATVNTSGNALDVDGTVDPLTLDNVFLQTGGAVSTGTLRKVFDSNVGADAGGAGSLVIYTKPSAMLPAKFGVPVTGDKYTVANNGTVSMGLAANLLGFVFIQVSTQRGAIYYLKGSANATIEVSDPDAYFTPTAGNAGTINVYYDAGTLSYLIENKIGLSRDISWITLGGTL